MNTIQKAAFAASSLVITLVGSAFVTAPMAFARAMPAAAHVECSALALHETLSHQAGCTEVIGKGGRAAHPKERSAS